MMCTLFSAKPLRCKMGRSPDGFVLHLVPVATQPHPHDNKQRHAQPMRPTHSHHQPPLVTTRPRTR